MKRVVIESPFAGDREKNLRYARACLLDSLERGEAPYASHLLYPQCLDDEDERERQLGMQAGFAWLTCAQLQAVYTDLGISPGMARGITVAQNHDVPVEYRKLGGEWSE